MNSFSPFYDKKGQPWLANKSAKQVVPKKALDDAAKNMITYLVLGVFCCSILKGG